MPPFQFQGPSGTASRGGGSFGGNIVGRIGGYGTGRGQAQAKGRAQKQEAFGALAKGRAGPAEIQSRAKGLFSKQVIDPEVEAARAGDVVAGAQTQALRKLQSSRGAKTGDITARGRLSIKRALKGTGERTMLKARGEAKQAADIANRQAQQDALRLEMGAQAQQSPFDMAQADFISREQFNTPDRMGGGFAFGGGGGSRGGSSYGGVVGAQIRNRPRGGRGAPSPDVIPPLLARPTGQPGSGQMGPPAPAGGRGGLSRAQQAANRQSHRDSAALRSRQRQAMRDTALRLMTGIGGVDRSKIPPLRPPGGATPFKWPEQAPRGQGPGWNIPFSTPR